MKIQWTSIIIVHSYVYLVALFLLNDSLYYVKTINPTINRDIM